MNQPTADSMVERQSDLIRELRGRIRQLERQIEELLAPAVSVPLEWGLSLTESRLYACLAAREMASKKMIMDAIYGDRIDGCDDPHIVSTHVYKLRPKLKPAGIEIVNVFGRGYSLRRPEEKKS
ncbi:winged helix-turn-helix domain-containing protein [Mesorhizobium loti]|nr:winged helix-turn-helix domain-containing protein [Mesorhizobium loti]